MEIQWSVIASKLLRNWYKFIDFFYDLFHDIKSRGRIEPFELDLPDQSLSSSRAYQPAPYRVLIDIFARLKVLSPSIEQCIDIGCGKGRALMVAHSFQLNTLIGIDLSETLIGECKNNLSNKKITSLNLYTADAAEFDYSIHAKNIDTIFFLNNPFDAAIMRPVAEKLKNVMSKNSVIVYVNPLREHVFLQLGFKKVLEIDSINHNYKRSFFKV